jgi:hypothetical protein
MDGVVTLNALEWRSASKKRPRKRVMSARRLSILLLTSLSVCNQCRRISDGAREDRTGPVDRAISRSEQRMSASKAPTAMVRDAGECNRAAHQDGLGHSFCKALGLFGGTLSETFSSSCATVEPKNNRLPALSQVSEQVVRHDAPHQRRGG